MEAAGAKNVPRIVLKQRDRFSIEMKFRHLVKKREKQRLYRYGISIYFFFPQPFNINRNTYDRSTFYDHVKLYMRFNTPQFGIEKLLDPAHDTSPLVRVERMVEACGKDGPDGPDGADGTSIDRDEFIYESKLLGCIYKSLLRDSLNRFKRELPPTDRDVFIRKRLTRAVRKLHLTVQRFHRLTERLAAVGPDPEVMQHCRMMDEHLSLLFERYLTSFLDYCSYTGEAGAYDKIVRLIVKEMRYRKGMGFPTVVDGGDRKHLEEYVYREKMLKRYASEVLFFNVRRRDVGKGMEHLLYAVAAGIAMMIATSIAFFGQTTFGNLTGSLFVLLIGSYMLKDRIKDLFRDLFRKSIGSHFYDHTIRLYDLRHRKRLAKVKERVFFSPERKLEERITKIRNRGAFEQALFMDIGESVLVYNRKIELNAGTLHSIHNRITGLADIDIVSLERFLSYLSIQRERIPFSFSKNRIRIGTAKRMYHLNMIVHYHTPDSDVFERRRLVVDSEGIHRIEEVPVEPEKKGHSNGTAGPKPRHP